MTRSYIRHRILDFFFFFNPVLAVYVRMRGEDDTQNDSALDNDGDNRESLTTLTVFSTDFLSQYSARVFFARVGGGFSMLGK